LASSETQRPAANESAEASSDTVARSAVWRIIEASGTELLSFVIMIILARLLLPDDYGLVAIATVLVMGGQMLLYHGFAEAIIQRESLNNDHLNSGFFCNLVIACGLAVVLLALAWPVASLTNKPAFAPILSALAPTMISFGIVGIYQAKLRRDMNFRALAIRSLSAILAGGLAGILGALAGWGPWSLVAQQTTYAIVNIIVIVGFSTWHPRWDVSRARLRELAGFGWRIALVWLLEIFTRSGPILILGIFLDAALVGLYFVANRIFMAVGNLTFWSVGEISLPVLSRMQNQLERQRQASTQTLTITALVCIACYWGLAAVAEPLILVLLGQTWSGSILPLQILAAIGVLNAMTSTSSQILVSFGHPDASLRIQTIIAVLLAMAVTALAPMGLTAATLGVAATFVIATPITLWLLREKVGIALGEVIRAQLPLWLAGALMAAAVTALDHWLLANLAPVIRLLLGITTGAVIFPLLLLMLAPVLLKTTTGALWDAVRRKKGDQVSS
jgi:PST family polysaccharide transporter